MKIDAFGHFVPPEFARLAAEKAAYMALPNMCDVSFRTAYLEELGIDRQVLVCPGGGTELLFDDPATIQKMTGIFNDGMAEIARSQDRLIPIANVSLADPKAAAKEAERAVKQLGLKSVSIHTNAGGHMAHDEALFPFYEFMNEHSLPMWVHVSDSPAHAHLPFGIPALYGWPFNSTVLMHCLVFGGVFDRFPNLRVVIHHAGAMIPFFEQRMENSMERRLPVALQRPFMDYFHENFYVDSVVQGSRGAMLAAYAFYGPSHLMYGSDMPFITAKDRAIIESVEGLPMPPAEREQVFSGNITKLLGL